MKRFLFSTLFLLFCFSLNLSAQIPTATLVQIVKAEDERRYDSTLENLLKSKNAKIRERAALAVGRIGDERAISALAAMLETDEAVEVRAMVAFALGEIESAKCTDAILSSIRDEKNSEIFARTIEAAGKIASANPKDTKSAELAKEIVKALEEESIQPQPNSKVVLLALTAALRARPQGAETTVAKFLNAADSRVRADALNTLARLRAKNVNDKSRELLQKDTDAVVRANAARMLGIGEDKSAIDLLLNAATKDSDSRVRVSAIRALGSLKDAKVVSALLERAENLFADCKKSKFTPPIERNELLEITTALGRILTNSKNEQAIKFLNSFRGNSFDLAQSPEIEIALARISPSSYPSIIYSTFELKLLLESASNFSWRSLSDVAQGIGELANIESNKEDSFKKDAERNLRFILEQVESNRFENIKKRGYGKIQKEVILSIQAVPDILRAFAAFKTNDLAKILREHLNNQDVIVRSTAAELLGEQPTSKENIEALKTAFDYAFIRDKHENDAELAILDALFKLDKKESLPTLIVATNSQDYLVRKKAFDYLQDDIFKDSELVKITLDKFLAKKKNQVLPLGYDTSKLGVILNSNADYVRAVSRKNGSVKAVLTTTKGSFTIDLTPEDAPLTVDNFIKLARSNYFNGVSVHRVVPNFVMQDGDPRGDGNGGPGWQIRCEINMLSYERGAVGMALSGKDTGGSQWFVTHSPQPHLDGGYTVFGKVNEPDMKIVDSIVRGDKILSVKIVETSLTQRREGAKRQRRKN